jgi:hypothetical protein
VRLDDGFAVHGVATFRDLGSPRLDQFWFAATDSFAPYLYVAGGRPVPAVARFDLLGTPDETFGSGGIAVIPLDGVPFGLSAVGGLVVSGEFTRPDDSGTVEVVGAVRLLPDGSGLDPAFGTGGMLVLGAITGDSYPLRLSRLALDPRDGSYIAVEVRQVNSQYVSGLIRFGKDGVIDPTFGGDGYAELDEPRYIDGPIIRDLDVDSAGGTVVALEERTVRYRADGTRDPAFGSLGELADADGGVVTVLDLAIADGDRIVAYGSRVREPGYAVYRWDAHGDPDTTFGRGGRIRVPTFSRGGTVVARSLALVQSTPFGAPPGDRVFLTGNSSFRKHGHPEKAHSGWFGELVSETGSRATSLYTYRDPRPATEREHYPSDAVWVPGGVIVVGTNQIRTPSGEIDSPFLMKFTF